MTSADNKYVIAMVTDVGQLKDKSFNQGTWINLSFLITPRCKETDSGVTPGFRDAVTVLYPILHHKATRKTRRIGDVLWPM